MSERGRERKGAKETDGARVRVERMTLDSLTPAPYNPREISDAALLGLRASIDRFGLVQPPIFNERTKRLDGDGRTFAEIEEERRGES